MSRIFSTLAFIMIITTLPVLAAEEDGNDVARRIEKSIQSKLQSIQQENPDLTSCPITVTIDYECNREEDSWKVNFSNISILQKEESAADQTDENDAPECEVESTNIEQEENDVDDEDFATANKEDADESKSKIVDSSSNNIIGWILGIALVIVLFMLINPRLKNRLKQKTTTEDNDNNAKATVKKVTGKSKTVSSTPIITHPAVAAQQPTQPVEETVEEAVEKIIVEKEVEKEVVRTKSTEQLSPIVKYGDIAVLSQDELITENDYMSDSAEGAMFEFVFSPNMEAGEYDIANTCRQDLLKDISIIRPYVQDFETVINPTKITTLSKGKLRKKGMQWVVTEKVKIEIK